MKDYDLREVVVLVIGQHRVSSTWNTKLVNDCLNFEVKKFLHGLLVVKDELGTAHSLDTRVPVLDDDVVKFAMRCPATTKIVMAGEINQSQLMWS